MIKFNKVALAVLALSTTSIASAAMYEAPPGMMTEAAPSNHGPYVGIGVGGIGFENKITQDGTSGIIGVTDKTISNTADGGNYGLNSYLLAGYAYTFPNKVFLGGEIFGTLTNVPVSVNNNYSGSHAEPASSFTSSTDTSMTLEGTYGVRVLPGYQVTPSSVVYGIVGYSRARASTSTVNTYTTTPAGETSTANTSDSFWFNGLELGLGSMISVTDHIALRGDLIWTGYQSQTLASLSNVTSTSTASSSVTAKPTTLEANVGLVYMFD
jgi:opacity protein-like surface antigen